MVFGPAYTAAQHPQRRLACRMHAPRDMADELARSLRSVADTYTRSIHVLRMAEHVCTQAASARAVAAKLRRAAQALRTGQPFTQNPPEDPRDLSITQPGPQTPRFAATAL